MKNAIFILFLIMLPGYHYAQNCSSNPGGDQSICIGESLTLQGESSEFYADPLDATWSLVSSSPSTAVIFENANSLTTEVTLASGEPLTAGTYTFELCVICEDGLEACQTKNVIVGSIIIPPKLETHDTEVCGDYIKLVGSVPDPGVTATWFIDADFSGNVITNGNVLELYHNGNPACSYTITYKQSIGGCVESAETTINFTAEYPNLTAQVISPAACPSCSNRIRLYGNGLGCGGTAQWTAVSAPDGIALGEVNINTPNGQYTWVDLPADGEYCFEYTVLNGTCITSKDTVCCEIQQQTDFGLSFDEYFAYCQDVWDIEKLFLSEPFLEGATYQWNVQSSSIPNHGITFSDPNSNETAVYFNNAPMEIGEEGWFFVIAVNVTAGVCQGKKLYRFAVNPGVEVITEDISLLCGGDPFFKPRSNVTVTAFGTSLTFTVLASPTDAVPVGLITFEQETLNLTQEGEYCFEVNYSRAGVDPFTGLTVICTDTETFCVTVANVPPINCGSPIVTCLLTTQLNGNSPTNGQGEPIDIPVEWIQVEGPPVTILNADNENPTITDMEYDNIYKFQYIISNTPDCQISCFNTVTVRPEEECEICDVIAEVGECENGCIPVSLSGADTYTWIPSENVDDTDPEKPLICNADPGIYQVFGYVDGQLCGSTLVEIKGACVDLDCEFTLRKDCSICSCGVPSAGATIFDSNNSILSTIDTDVQITWSVNDGPFLEGGGVYSDYYTTGPYVLCANVTFEQNDGMPCDTTMCVEVACHGDCPTVSFTTCANPNFSEYPQCKDYNPEQACNYDGWIWAVDAAGNPIGEEFVVLPINGDISLGNNPFFISIFDVDNCESIPFGVTSWDGECNETVYFEPDCCTNSTPEITCGFDGSINFVPQCGTVEYLFNFTWICFNFTQTYSATAQEIQMGIFNLPTDPLCQYAFVNMQTVCANGTISSPSNCLFLDVKNGKCDEWHGECPLFGDGGKRSLDNHTFESVDRLFPNPVNNGQFYLQMDPTRYRDAGQLTVTIQDVSGKKVQTLIIAEGIYKQEISTSLPNGMYIVSVTNQSGALMFTERLIIGSTDQINKRP